MERPSDDDTVLINRRENKKIYFLVFGCFFVVVRRLLTGAWSRLESA